MADDKRKDQREDGKIDHAAIAALIAQQKAAAAALAEEQARQRQVIAGTLRDGMAKDQHAAQQPGQRVQGDAMQRFQSQQRSDQAMQERLRQAALNVPEPERDPGKWLRDEQARMQKEFFGNGQTAKPQQATSSPATDHAGDGYRAYAAQHVQAIELPSERRAREAQEADKSRLRDLEAKERATRVAIATGIVAEVNREQRQRAGQERARQREAERTHALDTAKREAAAKVITAPLQQPVSRLAALHANAMTAKEGRNQVAPEAARGDPEQSRLALAGAAQANPQTQRQIESLDGAERNAAQLRPRSQESEGRSRYAALIEMTDRKQGAAAKELTSDDTEKRAQRRNNSSEAKTGKVDREVTE